MRRYFFLVIISILIGLIWLIKNREDDYQICRENYKIYLNKEIYGIVTRKYIDRQEHFSKIVEIRTLSDKEMLTLDLDRGIFYKYIQEGDSLVKISGDSTIYIYRKNEVDTAITIDYGCNEKK